MLIGSVFSVGIKEVAPSQNSLSSSAIKTARMVFGDNLSEDSYWS